MQRIRVVHLQLAPCFKSNIIISQSFGEGNTFTKTGIKKENA